MEKKEKGDITLTYDNALGQAWAKFLLGEVVPYPKGIEVLAYPTQYYSVGIIKRNILVTAHGLI